MLPFDGATRGLPAEVGDGTAALLSNLVRRLHGN